MWPGRKKSLRFSLRTLLIGVAVLAMLLAWVSLYIQRFAAEVRAIELLRAAGAEVRTQTAAPSLVCRLLGEDRFQTATGVVYETDKIHTFSDKQLQPIREMHGLNLLEIKGAAITDSGMACLAELSNIQHLLLQQTSITGDGLRHLRRSEQNLKSVDLAYSPIEDKSVEFLAGFPHLASIDLSGTNVTDKGLGGLEQLPALRELNIDHTGVTDDGIARLMRSAPESLEVIHVTNTFVSLDYRRQYPNLLRGKFSAPNDKHRIARRELGLRGAQIIPRDELGRVWIASFSERWAEQGRNSDLLLLADLEGLDGVSFLGRNVDDDVIRHLPRMKYLTSLSLSFTSVGDAALKHLGGLGLDRLRNLSLVDTHVTDLGLRDLAGLARLRNLHLGRTAITDEGLVDLNKLPDLHELDLAKTTVTDAGLRHIQSLDALEQVDLTGTQVTDAGVAELQAARPNLLIIRNQR